MPRDSITKLYTRPVNSFSDPVLGEVIDPTDATALFNDQDTAGFNNLPAELVSGEFTSILIGESTPIISGSLLEAFKNNATVQLTVVSSLSAVSIVSSDFGLVMRGVNTAGQDSGAVRTVTSQLGASYGHPTSANGAAIRPLEAHVIRSADVPFATMMGIEVGVHAGIGSGWDGTGTVPAVASVGVSAGSTSVGWLTEPGVRNDVGVFVGGANGWRRGLQYSDGSNNNIWYVDQNGAMFLSRIDNGATAGPVFTLDRNSASPAPSDLIGNISFTGRNASAATVQYAQEEVAILSTTAGAHNGEWAVKTAVSGAVDYRLVIASGMQVGLPTGGDKGPSTINAAGSIYVNNAAVLVTGGAGGTPSSLTLTNATGLPVAGITSSTSTALGVGSLEVGHASDTTITRVSAGVIAVEGVPVGRTFVLSFTRDISAANGSVSYTGVGFKPTSLTASGCVGGSADYAQASGFCDSALNQGSVNLTASGGTVSTNTFIRAINSAFSNIHAGTVTSMDSDGFTIAWVKTGTPTGTATYYILCQT